MSAECARGCVEAFNHMQDYDSDLAHVWELFDPQQLNPERCGESSDEGVIVSLADGFRRDNDILEIPKWLPGRGIRVLSF